MYDAVVTGAKDTATKTNFLPISEYNQQLVKETLNLDIENKALRLDKSYMAHIINRHGELSQERIPITKEDITDLPKSQLMWDEVKPGAQEKDGTQAIQAWVNNMRATYIVKSKRLHLHSLFIKDQ